MTEKKRERSGKPGPETPRKAIARRRFLTGAFAGAAAAGIQFPSPGSLRAAPAEGAEAAGQGWSGALAKAAGDAARKDYRGPNVILVRFGGGVRRRETIDPRHTYSPYFLHEFAKRGTFYPRMDIASIEGLQTSHGPGTLNILTGKYDRYEDALGRPIGERYEAKVPTLFEYMRKAYNIAEHETLIVNGEDRIDEEFYTFSNHHLYGVDYRSDVLSLYRFKMHLLREGFAEGKWNGKELQEKQKKYAQMLKLDHRAGERERRTPEIDAFWEKWRAFYGDTGFVNPRGDRLLTELAIRAMRELRPRFMMINYNDCDYVHWGTLAHYTRGIQIMDEGLQRLWEAAQAQEEYRDNTVFAVVPDCGRDSNRLMSVACQHHFGDRTSHEIFASFVGPGIAEGAVVDKTVDQIQVTATIGAITGAPTQMAEAAVLEEVLA